MTIFYYCSQSLLQDSWKRFQFLVQKKCIICMGGIFHVCWQLRRLSLHWVILKISRDRNKWGNPCSWPMQLRDWLIEGFRLSNTLFHSSFISTLFNLLLKYLEALKQIILFSGIQVAWFWIHFIFKWFCTFWHIFSLQGVNMYVCL